MYYHPIDDQEEEQEVYRYLSWRQKRRIVAAGFILMTIAGFIIAVNG
jgi:hypothetical protein